MTEIEDKIKSILSSMEDKSALESNQKQLAELQTEMTTIQETLQEKITTLESQISTSNQTPTPPAD